MCECCNFQALKHPYFSTPPLPCRLSEMPKPPADHRQRLKSKELTVDKSPAELFHDLQKLIDVCDH